MLKTKKEFVPLSDEQKLEFIQIQSDYGPFVYKVAFGFSHNREDAQDIAQETFLKAYKNYNGFKGDSSITTWLHTIAKNTYLDIRRAQKTNSLIDNLVGTDGQVALQIPDPRQNAAVKIFPKGYFVSDLTKAVSSLSEVKQQVLELSGDGHSGKEIAALLDFNPHKIRSILLRVKKELQGKLNPPSCAGISAL